MPVLEAASVPAEQALEVIEQAAALGIDAPTLGPVDTATNAGSVTVVAEQDPASEMAAWLIQRGIAFTATP